MASARPGGQPDAQIDAQPGSFPRAQPVAQPGPSSSSLSQFDFPVAALHSHIDVPVHIDVGGVIYTTTMLTLTKHPHSRLAKMFTGKISIVVDDLKQHYFIDRDGHMFRHILNYLRNDCVYLPVDFKYIDLLIAEAQFYDLMEMVYQLQSIKEIRDIASEQN